MKRGKLVYLTGVCLLFICLTMSLITACTAPGTAQTPAPSQTPTLNPTPVPAPASELTLTPTPAPTPTMTPTPTSTPTATPTPEPTQLPVQRATVEIGRTELHIGQSIEIPIVVKNVNDALGLGAYHLGIDFNPQGIRVDKALGGDTPFNMTVANITQGHVEITSFHTQMPGPTGEIIIARLTITALSQGNWPLAISNSPKELVNTDGDMIAPDIINGTINVTQ